MFTHAGVIEAKLGRTTNAQSWLNKAHDLQRMLLPSEQLQLAATLNILSTRRENGAISAREDQIANASSTNKTNVRETNENKSN